MTQKQFLKLKQNDTLYGAGGFFTVQYVYPKTMEIRIMNNQTCQMVITHFKAVRHLKVRK